ncbi:three prime repair exonuclease 2-like [Anneissia japonica]|uniref:three prime repair exonuclease 2-like n=1 Tax=Anneissia japonica TaxID=1529436 RepID=UPI0014258B51|nr:three prime repair exonuclease 2-like [Anneissia japonica]
MMLGHVQPSHPIIKSFVFFDLETSALHAEDRPKVTELCLIAVHRSSVESSDTAPRVMDKLTLCMYPNKEISPIASNLTGLHNALMLNNDKRPFDVQVCESICAFLGRQAKPVCLVAHNGYEFDFKLLRTEFDRLGRSLPSNLVCCDSLLAFRELEGADWQAWKRPRRSYALQKMFVRTFGVKPRNVHGAESDVITLLKLVLNRENAVCRWMDEHATRWTDVQPYYIPKKI